MIRGKGMLEPYRQVEETDEYVVYEYKTVYLYVMYGLMALIWAAALAMSFVFLLVGTVLLSLYLLLVSTKHMRLWRIFRRAARASCVGLSGSKWSFSHPLRLKINREFIEEGDKAI